MLSGGEGQRVRLGRALFRKNPRLVLLDEPFRGLDRGQRKALLAEARDWWKDSTLLCVTHDLWETLNFKRVLVIENGLIVEDGSPEELVSGETRYRELIVAETLIRDTFLRGEGWRQLRVDDGRLHDRMIVA
jgi:ATP-binding cassette subfamily B protein